MKVSDCWNLVPAALDLPGEGLPGLPGEGAWLPGSAPGVLELVPWLYAEGSCWHGLTFSFPAEGFWLPVSASWLLVSSSWLPGLGSTIDW